ncbi:aminotransferase class I/II-fold pyridoxal phosphate-dependent enzyme [Flavihumibacter fluvii]|uniref:aminotransferase class I/II-fold pyridoxal phosphate-dependent enzyme n=1 Tax=Flavihumibacter fluvii TaxID=2838157 RepID=UPI001BDE0373|nr:pyridoxal phosphate-dependent aminotransferase family protein [Flavihumibacter fluvii]ULQ54266.1 pyridoxal phosphate-dependent aminotransferase family protein [Flavihumibacter fluvii]
MKENFLQLKLDERRAANAFRELKIQDGMVDFCSNDYLGLSRQPLPYATGKQLLGHGSTGSRLLSGNSALVMALEKKIAAFHEAEAATLFNSGYDANLGLLSAVIRKGDTVIYDQLSHASIRDGIRLGFGQSFAFRHNDMADLENKLQQPRGGEKFVVTESVFSMDGDTAPLTEISAICDRHHAHLIVDEAHGLGVIGDRGEGLAQSLGLHRSCFARIYTYGKAAGAHGAAIAGTSLLRNYLVNFSRPFIYTTAAPALALLAIDAAYDRFPGMVQERAHLAGLVRQFQEAGIIYEKMVSHTPIQGVIVPGNEAVRLIATKIQQVGIDVRPILYPTVPKGSERLRIVLHAFNTAAELDQLIRCLQ